jgi:deazaflavin-dependent oxidoreductase (nitroreductase family)
MIRPVELLRALVRRLGSRRWFLWLTSRILPPVDRAVHRITGQRATVTQFVLPILMLTHTGRSSGRQRQTPLTYVEVEGGWAVAASSFGRGDHPQWSENLLEHPDAEVLVGDSHHRVTARLVDDEEHAELMPRFEELWPPYRAYLRRLQWRGIRIFVLERVDPPRGWVPGRLP